MSPGPDIVRGRLPLSTATELPAELADLADLVLDLHWTWSHRADALWRQIDAETWDRTRNPWIILQEASTIRLKELAADQGFVAELRRLVSQRRAELGTPGWFATSADSSKLRGVAYFSMEFGVGEALPLYAGGLGILAGDILKTASDLDVPIYGIGLLYQEGYFRQIIDSSGWQREAYPYNEPAMLPVQPALGSDGSWLQIPLSLPGRTLLLRVWKVTVGRAVLYLLDSNYPFNSAADRGITAKLYGGGSEMRLMQDIVLGVAGWRAIQALHPGTDVCHLNEGHAAFAVLERARLLASQAGLGFWEAFWAARGGNVFTTHTPVDAAFDRFPAALVAKYHAYASTGGIGAELQDLLALGRTDADAQDEPFNMAYLALRGSAVTFGVSRLHGTVSRRLFQPLFQGWPTDEVPIGHITNGVHVPSWDSAEADNIWTAACGKDRWRGMPDNLTASIENTTDDLLWAMRGENRHRLVESVRRRLRKQLSERGLPGAMVALSERVLDPNVLTLGFARRFTGYKRPNLLLHDPERLRRLLANQQRPIQLVVAGKAHPDDGEGKRMIQEWLQFGERPDCRRRLVFLEDYDLSIAQELVQGVDVWINTPRRPWEACGTSGMKVLVNGGINLSVLDGWWAEAWEGGLGWGIGDPKDAPDGRDQDLIDTERLYAVIEEEVVPEFYNRDASGVPRDWLKRMRRSMASLTPTYATTRMIREYISKAYVPAAEGLRRRLAEGAAVAKGIALWQQRVRQYWSGLHLGEPNIAREDDAWRFLVPVYLGEMEAEDIRVELYADPLAAETPEILPLVRGEPIPGAVNSYIYSGHAPASRPPEHFTVRVVPDYPGAQIPGELPLIRWQR